MDHLFHLATEKTDEKQDMWESFWRLYPRKVAKKDARKAWDKLSTDARERAITAIREHRKHWEFEARGIQFIPHASTWINGERFEDELVCPVPIVAWWTSEEGTLEYGRKKGVPARPGEDLATYRARLRAA